MANKKRLDHLLLEHGFAPSREKAQALILSGLVLVNDRPAEKAGLQVAVDAAIRLRGEVPRFVSRGGDKIDPALDYFKVAVNAVVALDIGASTGGFTDCLLQRGAARVYAVDVGFNQLHYKLRQDSRVVVMEKTHAVNLRAEQFPAPPSLAVIDVSFIGLRKVLAPVLHVMRQPAVIVALVKPQFELGPEHVSKGGVVKSKELQLEAVRLVEAYGAELGLTSNGCFASPVKGAKSGNQEYFVCLRSGG
ncbi:MAG TPA: TlyA family RNA methyltransferase [Oligoflexia bacterium]|nr:TlyA family RNA methyltransferase [Oligoflexia bacterium]